MMRKYLVTILCLLFLATPAFAASGKIYLGKYIWGTEWAATPDEQRGADWRVGIYIEEDFGWFVPYGEVETTIDRSFDEKYAFHPSAVLYTVGVRVPLPQDLTLKLEHACWHHIDSAPGVDHINQQYNLVELVWSFGGD